MSHHEGHFFIRGIHKPHGQLRGRRLTKYEYFTILRGVGVENFKVLLKSALKENSFIQKITHKIAQFNSLISIIGAVFSTIIG